MIYSYTGTSFENMPPVQRRVVNRLVRFACTEILQEILNELESKKKRKWVKAWVIPLLTDHSTFN